jgi:signal transduction histidine kinase
MSYSRRIWCRSGPNPQKHDDKVLNSLRLWWNGRKLVSKYSLLLLAAALLIIPLTQLAVGGSLQPVFDQIEQQDVRDQKARVKHALSEFETSLQNATLDYAVWDDMYAYVQHPNLGFEHQTLMPISQMNNAIDYRGIVRANGEVIWSSEVDLVKVERLPIESAAMKSVLTEPAFLRRALAVKKTITYVQAKRGLYLLTTARIIKSDESGAPRGFVVNGVLLNKKSLSETLQVSVALGAAPRGQAAAAMIAAPDHSISAIGDSAITTRIGLFGLQQNLLGTIDFSTPRSISAAGTSAIKVAAFAVTFAILALITLLGFGIRHITVRRLQALETYVRNFRTDGHQLPPAMTDGQDEIASLSRQFQALSEQLTEAEELLRQRSYLQGKADSAAGMLHNVRNALAPVRVMQEKWLREETLPYRTNMQKAVDELGDAGIDPARKTSLEQFLISAARTIAVSAAGRLTEMEDIKGSVDQISEILSSYNFDTSSAKAGDDIDLKQILQQQFKTLSVRSAERVALILPETLPAVTGNRVHLSQVLGNIFVNAHEAMTAAGVPAMKLIVSCEPGDTPDRVTIRITDNGDGIAAENIPMAFQRGYSTRSHKTGGLGMHWSANAMRAMGGSIALESDGIGKGASALLTLTRAKVAEERLAA